MSTLLYALVVLPMWMFWGIPAVEGLQDLPVPHEVVMVTGMLLAAVVVYGMVGPWVYRLVQRLFWQRLPMAWVSPWIRAMATIGLGPILFSELVTAVVLFSTESHRITTELLAKARCAMPFVPLSHPTVSDGYRKLAFAAIDVMAYDDAEHLFISLIEHYAQSAFFRHAGAVHDLAVFYDMQGRRHEAETRYKESIAILEAELQRPNGDDDRVFQYLPGFMDNLATFYFNLRRKDEYQQVCTQVEEGLKPYMETMTALHTNPKATLAELDQCRASYQGLTMP